MKRVNIDGQYENYKKQKQKRQGLILSLKNTILEKPEDKCQTEPPSLSRIKTLI